MRKYYISTQFHGAKYINHSFLEANIKSSKITEKLQKVTKTILFHWYQLLPCRRHLVFSVKLQTFNTAVCLFNCMWHRYWHCKTKCFSSFMSQFSSDSATNCSLCLQYSRVMSVTFFSAPSIIFWAPESINWGQFRLILQLLLFRCASEQVFERNLSLKRCISCRSIHRRSRFQVYKRPFKYIP